MQPSIAFCSRCRGMEVAWNKRYIVHWLLCKQGLRNAARLAGLAFITVALLLAFPTPNASGLSGGNALQPIQEAGLQGSVALVSTAVRSMDTFLKLHQVREANRSRLAQSIVASARKYNLNAMLIASIMIVESRGNPFAISGKDSIGLMQIHLPTWGQAAERENYNLLKIEDNVDFGARILHNYVRQFGLWEGVKRYNGYFANNPVSEQSAEEYAAKVRRIFELQQAAISGDLASSLSQP